MPDSQQSSLFTRGVEDAPAKMNDRELLRAAYDSVAVLSMGNAGIAAHTVARLRGELLAAVRELATRWHMDVSA